MVAPMMLRSVPLCLALCAAAAPLSALDVITFSEDARIDEARLPVPMQLYLDALSETRLAVTLAGDLWNIQRNIPAILSQQLEDNCQRDIAIAVSDARAEGRMIRINGQLQATLYACRDTGERQVREMLLDQTASISALLEGRLAGECLEAQVLETDVRPDGLTGALFDAVGYTPVLARELERQLDDFLSEQENCFELPPELKALDTRITGGGFRDLGDGRIGAEIHGTIDTTAENVIELITLLNEQGQFGN